MIVELTNKNFEQEALESNIPVLVDFWASWCMPCKRIAPMIEIIAEEYNGKIKVGKLNISDFSEKATSYGIMSIPTLIIFKDGKVMEQMVGVIPKSELESKIKLYI